MTTPANNYHDAREMMLSTIVRCVLPDIEAFVAGCRDCDGSGDVIDGHYGQIVPCPCCGDMRRTLKAVASTRAALAQLEQAYRGGAR